MVITGKITSEFAALAVVTGLLAGVTFTLL